MTRAETVRILVRRARYGCRIGAGRPTGSGFLIVLRRVVSKFEEIRDLLRATVPPSDRVVRSPPPQLDDVDFPALERRGQLAALEGAAGLAGRPDEIRGRAVGADRFGTLDELHTILARSIGRGHVLAVDGGSRLPRSPRLKIAEASTTVLGAAPGDGGLAVWVSVDA